MKKSKRREPGIKVEKKIAEGRDDEPNEKGFSRRIAAYRPLFLIIVIASFLLFSNLGNQYLWQDEAETALVGKTILAHGLPLGRDGTHSFSQDMGKSYGENYVWKVHPWLQFYTVALSFAAWGTSTVSARFPFALFGIATIVLVFFFTEEMFRNRRTALTASGLLTLSVPFLILCRQCRYYSASAFFFLLSAWFYLRFIQQKKLSFAGLVIASTLLFHTFYPYCIIFIVSIAVHAFLFHRDKIKKLFLSLLIVILINFPWLFWFTGTSYDKIHGNPYDPARIISFLSTYCKDLGLFVFTPWLFLVMIVLVAYHYFNRAKVPWDLRRLWNPLTLLALFAAMTLGVFSLSTDPFFRYLTPLIPILCIVMALIIDLSFNVHALFAMIVLAFLVWIQPLSDYYYEITHDYDGPIKGIVRFLNENGKENDIVLITYGDLPLKFYTKMKITGGLTGENLDAARNADWIIMRKHIASPYEIPVRRYVRDHISPMNYEAVPIHYPDIPYENREDPRQHHFRTATKEDRVIIYRKIRSSSSP